MLPPLLFADEAASRLCSEGPPFGLLTNRSKHTCLVKVSRLMATASNTTAQHPGIAAGSSCAVVGNSGCLLGSRLGLAIDAHDVVIRFNAAPSGGVWTHDVGGKATLRILGEWVAQMRIAHPLDTRSSALHGTLLYCMTNWLGDCVRRGTSSPDPKQRRRWLVNPTLVRAVTDVLHSHTNAHRTVPSTGLLGAAIARDACASVTLFGFGNASSQRRRIGRASTPRYCEHYYECALADGRFPEFASAISTRYHDFAAEAQVVEAWSASKAGSVTIVDAASMGADGSAASSLQQQSALIEERWRRQFGGKHIRRTPKGVHFPPEAPVNIPEDA